jgi:putative ABC transport system permease protein
MLLNYLKIAFRNLRRYKSISFINLFGLTVGLTACLVILSYYLDEKSYDRHHRNAENIYRVAVNWKWNGGSINSAAVSGPMAPLLTQNFPEVEKATRFFAEGGEFVRSGQQTIELSPIFTENSFFQVFDQVFIAGNAQSALTEPNSIVLTESAAKKIFGNTSEAMGKTVEYINRAPQKVVGIIKDVPRQSHFRFDAVDMLDTKSDFVKSFNGFNIYTYVVLKKGTNTPRLEESISRFFAKQMNTPAADFHLPLQPLTSIHLHSNLNSELQANGNILYLYIFLMIAGIILLLACINYINLATAQSLRRAKEVGIRKVMGSARWQLVCQYFTESFLLVITASLLSILLMQLVSPVIANITGRDISIWDNGWKFVTGVILCASIVVGFLSGIYPALFLSNFKPISVLKGVFSKSPSSIFFRRSLVVFQFSISTALIAFTWIIYQQLNYSTKKDLGFTKDQVMGIRVPYDVRMKSLTSFKTQLQGFPGISGIASTTNPLGNDNIGAQGFFLESGGQKPENPRTVSKLGIDPGYLNMMQIPVLQGRNFDAGIASDSTLALIVNETLVKNAGWKDPIGKKIWYFIDEKGNTREAKVVGVIKDFHIASLHKPIDPLILYMAGKEDCDNLYVKLKADNVAASLAYIQKTYKEFDNFSPYQTYFLDQNFARQYEEDSRKGNLFLLFTFLAIFIACLGLFGLITFTVEQRAKEISIRKVLGASVQNLVLLLSKDFLFLVVIAFVIAIPVAWWAMSAWLQNYAYRVNISWWVLAMAGATALIITLLTISIQAIKAAFANPAKTLRSE